MKKEPERWRSWRARECEPIMGVWGRSGAFRSQTNPVLINISKITRCITATANRPWLASWRYLTTKFPSVKRLMTGGWSGVECERMVSITDWLNSSTRSTHSVSRHTWLTRHNIHTTSTATVNTMNHKLCLYSSSSHWNTANKATGAVPALRWEAFSYAVYVKAHLHRFLHQQLSQLVKHSHRLTVTCLLKLQLNAHNQLHCFNRSNYRDT